MTKNIKVFLIILGLLSVVSGVIMAFTGSEFSEYFSGIFIGITLAGSAIFYKSDTDGSNE